ncbi:MAG: hypothetical protein ACKOUM_00380 [Sphingopyxis sp.]
MVPPGIPQLDRMPYMPRFNLQAALSYTAATIVSLLSTTMLFAAATVPSAAHLAHGLA